MKTHSFFSRFYHSPTPRLCAVLLVALALSSIVSSCGRNNVGRGEIIDAVKAGDLVKVKALLKNNPDWVFSKGNDGGTLLSAAVLMD